jgi:two-component system, NtrC family, response regulator HydG
MSTLRILVVDDDRDFAESLAEVLRLDGHEVDTVYTGERAVERFREVNYDLTFMDVKLPGRNGVEWFLELRKLKPSARVFMLTGFSVPQLLDEAVAKGVCGVLQKPLDPGQLLKTVEGMKLGGILIADDDPDFVESMRELLAQNGHVVYVARDGREALDRLASNGIDVLVLDLRMPIINGLEVYLEMERRGRQLPTILVTAYAHEEAAAMDMFRALPMTGILTKPFDPARLLEAIQELTGKQGGAE